MYVGIMAAWLKSFFRAFSVQSKKNASVKTSGVLFGRVLVEINITFGLGQDMGPILNITELSELNKSNIHIRNKNELLEKINKLVLDGYNQLQILSDFDHTMTRYEMDNGEIVLTSFGMFKSCPSIPQHYKDEDNRVAAIYKPIEVDPVMSKVEKAKNMEQWYKIGRDRLKGLKFPRNELTEISKQMVKCFRLGVRELISWSQVHNVPVLVFSAGFGECVVAALEAANFLQPNVKVISNFAELDENDIILGPKGDKFIHAYNKNEAAIKETEYYEMVKDRTNVILMGDIIGDAGMAEGMEHCEVIIKIGFLGRNMESNLQNYMNEFDIVLVDDPTMDVANAILKLMH